MLLVSTVISVNNLVVVALSVGMPSATPLLDAITSFLPPSLSLFEVTSPCRVLLKGRRIGSRSLLASPPIFSCNILLLEAHTRSPHSSLAIASAQPASSWRASQLLAPSTSIALQEDSPLVSSPETIITKLAVFCRLARAHRSTLWACINAETAFRVYNRGGGRHSNF
jgi:hypothetical protein